MDVVVFDSFHCICPMQDYSLEDLRTAYDMLHVVLDEAERLQEEEGNGPTRNSSGAVAADLWCSELKRGADGVKTRPCLSNYWPKRKHDKPHRFCKHP